MMLNRTWINICLTGGLVALLPVLTINKLASAGFMNADTLLFSIMSLQNVTPFIWGQDRLANFIPLALAWITEPGSNLFAHLYIFAFSFYLLLWEIAAFTAQAVSPKIDGGTRLAFACAVAVSLGILSPYAIHVFAIEGQPYALSYFLLFAGYRRLRAWENQTGTKEWLIVFGLFVSCGLNPSIILAAGALTVSDIWLTRNWGSLRIFVVVVISFVVWIFLSKEYGVPTGMGRDGYASVDFSSAGHSIRQAFHQVVEQISIGWMVLLSGMIALGFALRKVHVTTLGSRSVALIWLFALGWLFVFANHQWVKANLLHFRYFFPIYVALLVTLTYFTFLSIATFRNMARRNIFMAIVGGCLLFLAAPAVEIADYPVVNRVAAYSGYVIGNNIRFVSGNYWVAWPVVYESLRNGREAYGLAYRGNGNFKTASAALEEEIASRGNAQVLCIQDAPTECARQISGFGRDFGYSVKPGPDGSVVLLLHRDMAS